MERKYGIKSLYAKDIVHGKLTACQRLHHREIAMPAFQNNISVLTCMDKLPKLSRKPAGLHFCILTKCGGRIWGAAKVFKETSKNNPVQ